MSTTDLCITPIKIAAVTLTSTPRKIAKSPREKTTEQNSQYVSMAYETIIPVKTNNQWECTFVGSRNVLIDIIQPDESFHQELYQSKASSFCSDSTLYTCGKLLL